MKTFPFSIVAFDLDGTLVDSNRDLAPAVNYALALEGRDPVPEDDVRDLIGGGAPRMLKRALERSGGPVSDERFEELSALLLEYYQDHIADNTVPFEGCLDALDDLATRGCKLAVCTNKAEAPARKLIGALGMTDRFACIIGGDTLGPGRAKPQPDMLHEAARLCADRAGARGPMAMIGDSSFDTRAARNAGMPAIALSFGYNDMPADELGADAVIDHYRELVPALLRLG